jgi:hypothetical protein
MGTYASTIREYDVDPLTYLWGGLLVLALLILGLAAWKAVHWLRDKLDAAAVGRVDLDNAQDQEPDFAITTGFEGEWLASPIDGFSSANTSTDMAGMNRREQEEFLLIYGSGKQRRAIKARRAARERAQKHDKRW